MTKELEDFIFNGIVFIGVIFIIALVIYLTKRNNDKAEQYYNYLYKYKKGKK